MTSRQGGSVKVFLSYSHNDRKLREKLDAHLAVLKRNQLIHTWNDAEIAAGRAFQNEIAANLEVADVVLLLVSSSFLASDFCYCTEMKRAMERYEAGQATVIPIIIRPCDWQGAPFGKLLALPTDGKAVTSWRDHHAALLNVAKGIEKAIQSIIAGSARGAVERTSDRLLEPDLDCVPVEVESESDDIGFIVCNNSNYALTAVLTMLRIPIQKGEDGDVFQAAAGMALGDLGPEASVAFRYPGAFKRYFERLSDCRPEEDDEFLHQVLLHVSGQRQIDGSSFYFAFRYRIFRHDGSSALELAHKERIKTLARLILRPISKEQDPGGEYFLEPKPSTRSSGR
jgi:TIR domain